MEKFNEFYKFCKYFKKSIELENDFTKIGLIITGEGKLSIIDELLSLIPNLIFNEEGVEIFWNLILDNELSDDYIDQLWDELKEYQL